MVYVQFGVEQQYLRLYYDVHGSGQTKILFIMGLLADGDAWSFQVDVLDRKQRIIFQSIFRRTISVNNPTIKYIMKSIDLSIAIHFNLTSHCRYL
jgi:hypothetical protein